MVQNFALLKAALILEAISQMFKRRLAVLLTSCFVTPQSQITADMLFRRALHPAKIPRDPQPVHL